MACSRLEVPGLRGDRRRRRLDRRHRRRSPASTASGSSARTNRGLSRARNTGLEAATRRDRRVHRRRRLPRPGLADVPRRDVREHVARRRRRPQPAAARGRLDRRVRRQRAGRADPRAALRRRGRAHPGLQHGVPQGRARGHRRLRPAVPRRRATTSTSAGASSRRGGTLGFSPAAIVWHHRRNSVRAYWRQQRGYGKAEAMLEAKWPEKYNALGHLTWSGRLYGPGLGAGPHVRPKPHLPRPRRIGAVPVSVPARRQSHDRASSHAGVLSAPPVARGARGLGKSVVSAPMGARPVRDGPRRPDRSGSPERPPGRVRRPDRIRSVGWKAFSLDHLPAPDATGRAASWPHPARPDAVAERRRVLLAASAEPRGRVGGALDGAGRSPRPLERALSMRRWTRPRHGLRRLGPRSPRRLSRRRAAAARRGGARRAGSRWSVRGCGPACRLSASGPRRCSRGWRMYAALDGS